MCGGILSIMEEIKIGKIVISKQIQESENYKKFRQIIQEKGIPTLIVGANSSYIPKIQIEPNVYFEILWPQSKNSVSENVLNNNSIVCKLHYNNFSMLFTGDIEETAEMQILKEYESNLQVLNSTVLKVGHHGSKTSSTEEFIEAVNPKIALIGVGENNKFGHPNEEVLERLENLRS